MYSKHEVGGCLGVSSSVNFKIAAQQVIFISEWNLFWRSAHLFPIKWLFCCFNLFSLGAWSLGRDDVYAKPLSCHSMLWVQSPRGITPCWSRLNSVVWCFILIFAFFFFFRWVCGSRRLCGFPHLNAMQHEELSRATRQRLKSLKHSNSFGFEWWARVNFGIFWAAKWGTEKSRLFFFET